MVRPASDPPSAPTPSTGSTAQLDLRRLPWARPLATDYAFNFAGVADFFAGDPSQEADWADAIRRAQQHPRRRAELADIIAAQQTRRAAPSAARAAAARLAEVDTVAVVTGQQAGLFGGPLYTLLKALSALQLAAQVQARHGVPTVAVFWVDSEDHDWDEVRACTVLDAAMTPVTVALPERHGDAVPVARVTLDASVDAAIATLEQTLPPTDFTAGVLADLRASYVAGVGMSDAFGRWLERVLGPHGLVVYDASDPAAKPLAAPVFAHELAHPGVTTTLATATGTRLAARGYHAQVHPTADATALFSLAGGRRSIRCHGDQFMIGDTAVEAAQVREEASAHPEQFSPNVLLRPLVQDTLFPTICYVGGPSELAYLGQLKDVYAHFGVPMPLVHPRGTATLLDAGARRFLTRSGLPIEAFQSQDESALNQWLESQIPATVEAAFGHAERAIAESMEAVIAAMPSVDPTLESTSRSTLTRMQQDLRSLHGKMITAAKRRDETLRRQFTRTRAVTFPGGTPQERTICVIGFLNLYGPALVDRLLADVLPSLGHHTLVFL